MEHDSVLMASKMGTIFHKYLRKLILKNTLEYYANIELNIIN